MTLFPVIDRELRLASRERNTYRIRFLSAFLTILFCAFSLWFVTLWNEQPIPPRGLFIALAVIEFLFVLVIGFSLTADSVSEEKRESTLGLLFLTDLRGHDIIFGKFVGALTRGLYALIATIPVLALPLMLGGTDVFELGRTALTLMVTLLFSACIGMLFSTALTKGWTAYGLSAFAIVLFAAILPIYGDFARRFGNQTVLAQALEVLSPSYALAMCFKGSIGLSTNWWGWSVGTLAGLALGMLAASSLLLPHVWKDRPPKARRIDPRAIYRRFKFGGAIRRRELRGRFLAINPVLWLARRERICNMGFLLFFAAVGVAAEYILRQIASSRLPWEAVLVFGMLCWMGVAALLHAAILLRLPIVAAERFAEDRKTGALELLVSTPLTIREILRGHWKALRRYFAGPAAIALLMHIVPILHLIELLPIISNRGKSLSELLRELRDHFLGSPISDGWENHMAFLVMVALAPILALNWVSLACFSTYLSLKVKKVLTIPPLALAVLHVPPALALFSVFAFMGLNRWRIDNSFDESLFCFGLAVIFECISQIFWIVWSRKRLLRDFRVAATDRYQPPKPPRWWQWRIA
jgi:ABC-type transport system involved in multi-copper enzyme maturation permease subunit